MPNESRKAVDQALHRKRTEADDQEPPISSPGETEEQRLKEKIRKAAYRKFTERGGQHGHHDRDWYEAEAEIAGAGPAGRERLPEGSDAPSETSASETRTATPSRSGSGSPSGEPSELAQPTSRRK